MQIENQLPVFGGICWRRCRSDQTHEIGRATEVSEPDILAHEVFQDHGIDAATAVQKLGADAEDAPVRRVGEMVGPQEIGHGLDRLVAHEDDAEKRLLRDEVVRGRLSSRSCGRHEGRVHSVAALRGRIRAMMPSATSPTCFQVLASLMSRDSGAWAWVGFGVRCPGCVVILSSLPSRGLAPGSHGKAVCLAP